MESFYNSETYMYLLRAGFFPKQFIVDEVEENLYTIEHDDVLYTVSSCDYDESDDPEMLDMSIAMRNETIEKYHDSIMKPMNEYLTRKTGKEYAFLIEPSAQYNVTVVDKNDGGMAYLILDYRDTDEMLNVASQVLDEDTYESFLEDVNSGHCDYLMIFLDDIGEKLFEDFTHESILFVDRNDMYGVDFDEDDD